MSTKEKLIYWFTVPLIAALVPVLFGWQTLANLNGWIPADECPGKPIKLTITTPVSGIYLEQTNYGSYRNYSSSLVVKASHPIAEDWHLGFLSKGENDSQYTLDFPVPMKKLSKTEYVWNQVKAYSGNDSNRVEIRAVLADNYLRVGEHFSSVQQVVENDGVYSVSEPVIIHNSKKL